MILLQGCRYLVTQDDKRTILEGVDVLIEGSRIAKIGKDLPKMLPGGLPKETTVVDCSRKVVLPGLINCHTHLDIQLFRGVSDDKELHDWLDGIVPRKNGLDGGQLAEAAALGCREALRSGTTALADMHYTVTGTAATVEASGIRAWLFVSYNDRISQSDDVGASPIFSKYEGHPRITASVAPHSIYGCSERLLRNVHAYAQQHKIIQTIHLAETRKEQYKCKQQHGLLPAQYLDSIGFLDDRTLLAHCVWLTKDELRTIAQRGCSVVHCPTSNMKLASGGVMPLKEMRAAGINVALGTDSVVSNNSLDLFSEMKVAALLHKHHYWDPTMADAQSVLDMATRNGAKALGREEEFGSVEEGKRADAITLAITDHLTPIDKERVVSHLVYSANGNDVRDVIVDGELILEDGMFVE